MTTLRTMNRRRWRKANPRSPAYAAMGLNSYGRITYHWECIRGGRWMRCSPKNPDADADFYPAEFDEVHGVDEGQTCERNGCKGVLAMDPSSDREGCSCFRSAPCGYCMSIMPTCPTCRWREEDED